MEAAKLESQHSHIHKVHGDLDHDGDSSIKVGLPVPAQKVLTSLPEAAAGSFLPVQNGARVTHNGSMNGTSHTDDTDSDKRASGNEEGAAGGDHAESSSMIVVVQP
jgi:hypothetical protein